MKRSVNLNGTTPKGRRKAVKSAMSVENMVAVFRALGMSDDDIKAEVLKLKTGIEIKKK